MHDDRHYLDLGARLAWRAVGDVEPNPLVGAVLVKDGRIIGLGHHRRFGGAHAEREALDDARRGGHSPTGATMYVTLEPCAHSGHQAPCAEAIIDAGVLKVVYARTDPHPAARGGAEQLRAAGVEATLSDASTLATRISDPFVKRITTGLPWVIAKWAQTIDGRIATRSGRSRWISSARSRVDVHRLRARMDAIVTGIGTVTADDPDLTARDARRVRRVARRVVVDPSLRLLAASRLAQSAREAPVTIIATTEGVDAEHEQRRRLEAVGVEIVAMEPARNGRLDPGAILRLLVRVYDVTNVLVEAGPNLAGAIHDEGLIDELRVYIAPTLLGDDEALPPLAGSAKAHVADGTHYALTRLRRLGHDIEATYLRRR